MDGPEAPTDISISLDHSAIQSFPEQGTYYPHMPLPSTLLGQVYKVETAGDCYIVAGALMQKDEDGFLSLDNEEDAGGKGAEKVMAFAKVGRAGG